MWKIFNTHADFRLMHINNVHDQTNQHHVSLPERWVCVICVAFLQDCTHNKDFCEPSEIKKNIFEMSGIKYICIYICAQHTFNHMPIPIHMHDAVKATRTTCAAERSTAAIHQYYEFLPYRPCHINTTNAVYDTRKCAARLYVLYVWAAAARFLSLCSLP